MIVPKLVSEPECPSDDDSGCSPVYADVADSSAATAEASHDWAELVTRIKRQEPSGLEDLYRIFSRGIRFFLCRQLGPQELDDRVHDTFLIVVSAIQRGELREPDRLMGFVRTVVRRQVAAQIDRLVHSRREQIDLDSSSRIPDRSWNPEQALASRESSEMVLRILRSLSDRDREILTRFYLYEESQDQICREMELTETQFRLLKSRAKARFGEIGKKRLQQSSLISLFVRTSARSDH